MPGVLQIEAMAQTGGILLLTMDENRGKMAYLVGVEKARIRQKVVPGDQMLIETTITRFRQRVGKASSVIRVNGKVVAEADLLFSIGDEV